MMNLPQWMPLLLAVVGHFPLLCFGGAPDPVDCGYPDNFKGEEWISQYEANEGRRISTSFGDTSRDTTCCNIPRPLDQSFCYSSHSSEPHHYTIIEIRDINTCSMDTIPADGVMVTISVATEGTTAAADCENEIEAAETIKFAYLASIADQTVDSAPLIETEYYTVITKPNAQTICEGDTSSVMTVTADTLSLTSCQPADNNAGHMYTLDFTILAAFNASAILEDDSQGHFLILKREHGGKILFNVARYIETEHGYDLAVSYRSGLTSWVRGKAPEAGVVNEYQYTLYSMTRIGDCASTVAQMSPDSWWYQSLSNVAEKKYTPDYVENLLSGAVIIKEVCTSSTVEDDGIYTVRALEVLGNPQAYMCVASKVVGNVVVSQREDAEASTEATACPAILVSSEEPMLDFYVKAPYEADTVATVDFGFGESVYDMMLVQDDGVEPACAEGGTMTVAGDTITLNDCVEGDTYLLPRQVELKAVAMIPVTDALIRSAPDSPDVTDESGDVFIVMTAPNDLHPELPAFYVARATSLTEDAITMVIGIAKETDNTAIDARWYLAEVPDVTAYEYNAEHSRSYVHLTLTKPTVEPTGEPGDSMSTEGPDSGEHGMSTETPDSGENEMSTESPDSSANEMSTESPDSSANEMSTESPDSSENEMSTESPDSSENEMSTESPDSGEDMSTESSSDDMSTEGPDSGEDSMSTESPDASGSTMPDDSPTTKSDDEAAMSTESPENLTTEGSEHPATTEGPDAEATTAPDAPGPATSESPDAQSTADDQAPNITQDITDMVTGAATEDITVANTRAATEAATNAVTEDATDKMTDAVTDAETDPVTEAVTKAATIADVQSTEAPVAATTEAASSECSYPEAFIVEEGWWEASQGADLYRTKHYTETEVSTVEGTNDPVFEPCLSMHTSGEAVYTVRTIGGGQFCIYEQIIDNILVTRWNEPGTGDIDENTEATACEELIGDTSFVFLVKAPFSLDEVATVDCPFDRELYLMSHYTEDGTRACTNTDDAVTGTVGGPDVHLATCTDAGAATYAGPFNTNVTCVATFSSSTIGLEEGGNFLVTTAPTDLGSPAYYVARFDDRDDTTVDVTFSINSAEVSMTWSPEANASTTDTIDDIVYLRFEFTADLMRYIQFALDHDYDSMTDQEKEDLKNQVITQLAEAAGIDESRIRLELSAGSVVIDLFIAPGEPGEPSAEEAAQAITEALENGEIEIRDGDGNIIPIVPGSIVDMGTIPDPVPSTAAPLPPEQTTSANFGNIDLEGAGHLYMKFDNSYFRLVLPDPQAFENHLVDQFADFSGANKTRFINTEIREGSIEYEGDITAGENPTPQDVINTLKRGLRNGDLVLSAPDGTPLDTDLDSIRGHVLSGSCVNKPCEHGGLCMPEPKGGNDFTCNCPERYTGDRCQDEDDFYRTVIVLIVCVCAAVILMVLCVAVCICQCRREASKPPKEKEVNHNLIGHSWRADYLKLNGDV